MSADREDGLVAHGDRGFDRLLGLDVPLDLARFRIDPLRFGTARDVEFVAGRIRDESGDAPEDVVCPQVV